jgi:hypothetical protein
MEGRHPIELVRCGKRRVNGQPCRKFAIAGGTVCRLHGGSAPQVVPAAKLRLALAADAVTERLLKIALSKRRRDSDVIAAAKDPLDRAGVRAEKPTDERPNDGTVLWEELVEIHRRRVLEAGVRGELAAGEAPALPRRDVLVIE